MTLNDFYQTVGGNYTDVLDRLCDEEIIYEFLCRFAKEPIFNQLQHAINTQNREDAFTLIHTFKGTCANMGLGNLYSSAAVLTEALRTEFSDQVFSLFDALTLDYQAVLTNIQNLKRIEREQ